MTTTTLAPSSRHDVQLVQKRSESVRVGRLGLGTVGVFVVLLSTFAGLVAYAGPIIGYRANGSGSWHWDLAHTLLSLLPGAVGVVIGLVITAEARGVVIGRGRFTLALAGFVIMLCGAWLVVGPLALPVITNHGPYFAAARPSRLLLNELGYSFGPGVLLAVAGGFVAGWSSRHQPRSAPDVTTASTTVTPEIT